MLQLDLGSAKDQPTFLRISEAIVEAITQGRLAAGDALPGHRTLAESLGVHRNTVHAAYQELIAEGWVTATLGSGTHVAPRDLQPKAQASPQGEIPLRGNDRLGFDLDAIDEPRFRPEPSIPQTLDVRTGNPDPRLFPTTSLVRAYRRAITRRRGEALLSRDPQGDPHLRTELAKMLASTRGLSADPDSILITRGSQMALYLVANTLLRPGDAVAVEALGSPTLWRPLRHAGAELLPVPTDAEGLDTSLLERILQHRPLRAILVTSHRQYPTTQPMTAARRSHLLDLARRHRIPVIDLEFDSEFQYEGTQRLALAAQDPAGVVIHLGTLSKIFSPGLRLGFVHAPQPVIQRMFALRETIDRQGDSVLESAIAELLQDGEVQRHVNRLRRVYQGRRDALAAHLRSHLGDQVRFQVPDGGMALWVGADVDASAWAGQCLDLGVVVQPESHFDQGPGPHHHIRLGFSGHGEPELAEVARCVAQGYIALKEATR